MSVPRPYGRAQPKLWAGFVTGLLLVALPVIFTYSTKAEEGATAGVTVFDTPLHSSPIALSANKQHLWVVNPDDDSVSVIGDLDGTPRVIAKRRMVVTQRESLYLHALQEVQ